tara:strand:+ start:6501 stop:6878 length:378 start_codon:yes stop_codon:yes gene_type:complete
MIRNATNNITVLLSNPNQIISEDEYIDSLELILTQIDSASDSCYNQNWDLLGDFILDWYIYNDSDEFFNEINDIHEIVTDIYDEFKEFKNLDSEKLESIETDLLEIQRGINSLRLTIIRENDLDY